MGLLWMAQILRLVSTYSLAAERCNGSRQTVPVCNLASAKVCVCEACVCARVGGLSRVSEVGSGQASSEAGQLRKSGINQGDSQVCLRVCTELRTYVLGGGGSTGGLQVGASPIPVRPTDRQTDGLTATRPLASMDRHILDEVG